MTPEERYAEQVDIETRRFLQKYYNIQHLIPLCAVAFEYNKYRPYTRQIYNDFNLLTQDVRQHIFDVLKRPMCSFDLLSFKSNQNPNLPVEDFYSACIYMLRDTVQRYYPKDSFDIMFQNNAALLTQAFEKHGQWPMPRIDENYTKPMDEIFEKDDGEGAFPDQSIFKQITPIYFKPDITGKEHSQAACLMACRVAQKLTEIIGYNTAKLKADSLSNWNFVKNQTMEDLFLYTLLQIWIHLFDN